MQAFIQLSLSCYHFWRFYIFYFYSVLQLQNLCGHHWNMVTITFSTTSFLTKLDKMFTRDSQVIVLQNDDRVCENPKSLIKTSSQNPKLWIFCMSWKSSLSLPRNLPWRFDKIALVLVLKFSLLKWFQWSSLNMERVFGTLVRVFWKHKRGQKTAQLCYFSTLGIVSDSPSS